MAYYVKYRCEFDTIKGRQVKVDIEEDTLSAPTIIDLTAASESPLEISYPNGEFEKMCPIRESKARLKILSDVVTSEDFYITSDSQYKVKIYINNVLEWVGWLDNNIITEPFLDTANEIELTCNDGLSLLKTTQLKDQLDDQMWGFYKLKDFIANSLYQTKLNLDFVTFINQYASSELERNDNVPTSYDFDAFYWANIYATTFLKGPRDFDDCYDVLSKIMQSFGCTLFQARGKWYIIQTNDRIAGVLDGTIRDYTGTALNISMNQSYKLDIGLNEVTKLINADALTSVEKPFKEVAVKHSFDMPVVYFRNFDLLDRGVGNSPTYWTAAPTALASFYGYVNSGTINVDIEAGTNAEIRRYMVLRAATLSQTAFAKRTSIYPVNSGDKINFGFSVKFTDPYFRFGDVWAYVVFVNTSGVHYYLDLDGKWYTQFRSVGYSYHKDEDRRFWKSYNITSVGVPANGNVSIVLTGNSRDLISSNHDVYYKDLDFSVITQFNDMTEVDGYEQKSETSNNLKNKYDNEIFVSNAPNISTKGVLLDTDYVLRGNWYYKGDDANFMPFVKYITRSYWRSMYRKFIRLEGRLFDLYQGNRLLSPLNTVEFTEVEDKEFMITTLQMDIRQESSEFTMIELRNTLNNNDFTQNGTESFRYLNVKAKDENDPVKEPKTPIDWKFGTLGVISSLIRRNRRRRFNNYS
ncbi:MAG: hypothetical protein LW807_07550 [Proteobacteria bacterium]|nr:hypothetical protein [Pseudomonadota bacterium]